MIPCLLVWSKKRTLRILRKASAWSITELLIDHAWGYEPCTIAEIKAYKPETKSLNSGQVLHCPYDAEKAKLVIREMADLLSLDIVEKGLVTNQIVLTIGYDIENLTDPKRSTLYRGEVTIDHYGRKIPKHSQGTENSNTPHQQSALFKLYPICMTVLLIPIFWYEECIYPSII